MHARTHPAETCPSFLLEGMINYLLSGTPEASDMLSNFEFHIFPMQNPDGVITGNYRTTPQTENLEVMWFYKQYSPLELTENAPVEVKLIHEYARSLMEDDGPEISMALNLHASNSEPDIRPFFFPHFGTEEQGYSPAEATLWTNQIRFINALTEHHGSEMIEPTPAEGGSSFTSKTYPESWWWVNYQERVMAITMEMTYGRAGYSPKWIEPDDLRDLGVSLTLAIHDYYTQPTLYMLKSGGTINHRKLKYPELYPPNAVDELKE